MASRVLVVEDNEDNRALVVKVLSRAGYAVAEAVSGEEALESARVSPPDLVLMDLHLAGMDGLDATRRLKANPATRETPVVALTASAMDDDAVKAKDAGCDGYVTKPCEQMRLLEEVRRAMAKRPAGTAASDWPASGAASLMVTRG